MINLKKIIKLGIATTFAAATFFGTSTAKVDENAHAASIYSSCKAFNKKYPHGVKVSSKTKNKVKKRNGSVVYQYSSAKVSKTIYNKAMKYNSDLDRDNDKIACEK